MSKNQKQLLLEERLLSFSKMMDEKLNLPPNSRLERYFKDIFSVKKLSVIDLIYRTMFPFNLDAQKVIEQIFLHLQFPQIKLLNPFYTMKKNIHKIKGNIYDSQLAELGNKCQIELFSVDHPFVPLWACKDEEIKPIYEEFHNLINYNYPSNNTKLITLSSAFGKKEKLPCPFTYLQLSEMCGWNDTDKKIIEEKKPKSPLPLPKQPQILAKKQDDSTIFVLPSEKKSEKNVIDNEVQEKQPQINKEIEISSIPKVPRESIFSTKLPQQQPSVIVPQNERLLEVEWTDQNEIKEDQEILQYAQQIIEKLKARYVFSDTNEVKNILDVLSSWVN
ncbi:hypothetical protein EHI8A_008730 [Entamoeba histolytica HM-1:IMSS-B]|uniref:Uncharacterized protein n=7 Tax=Entamoeba histolytica TaxID=5759 RepID=A0A8U0WQ52_ENTH1|nr:hypothetical protein EHI_170460 [Entamoeba histolytica HM-1:IMSS]EMD48967.1 nuclear RNA binding protein, putative [Entamoeba histolytica KU27]EMH77742.1 hypothetical protein EHI8A_008730 [Entamoeba histolytica HM-1:IMSS-B]EMS14562.1 nuclear RNA binding protein B, putative [Entamoeba histolytica HM-3:IMSS]ENY64768.1 nuclear RNA binding protein B, putative [Entamoeba histolytica HM-1:IMSS-A]CAC34302.1 putative nuclear RNA binding protein B [Entamoeba histolytica]|eukprot:XP_651028.1 hypothetical protein EHI_170460 [Entamoeba histolytica HM-1:IMSS]